MYRAGAVTDRFERAGRGFTLVELLVSIAVVALLLALLLPALQRAREAARRASCSNNLRQIGLALQSYCDVFGCFPLAHCSGRNADGVYLQQSWTKQILPFLEQGSLADGWDPGLGFAQGANRDLLEIPMGVYKCPSSPAPPIDAFDLRGFPEADTTDPRGPEFAAGAAEYFAVSEFVGPWPRRFGSGLGLMPYPAGIRRARNVSVASVSDGLSNTAAVGECGGAGQVYRAGPRQADRKQTSALGHWAGRNRLSLRRFDSRGDRFGGGLCLVNCTNENGANYFGFHPGGANVLLADGSCRFLAELASVEAIGSLSVIDDGLVSAGF